MSDSPSVVAKYRVPLDAKRAKAVAEVVAEYPDHHFTIEGPFLVVHEGAA